MGSVGRFLSVLAQARRSEPHGSCRPGGARPAHGVAGRGTDAVARAESVSGSIAGRNRISAFPAVRTCPGERRGFTEERDMAAREPHPGGAPRPRPTIVDRIADAVRRLAGPPKANTPFSRPEGLARTRESREEALEHQVRESRAAMARVRRECETLAGIIRLLDRAQGLARQQGGSDRLNSVATVLGMTRSHVGLELEDAGERLQELSRLRDVLETGAANRGAASSLAEYAGPAVLSLRDAYPPLGTFEISGNVARYVLRIQGKVRRGGVDMAGEAQN